MDLRLSGDRLAGSALMARNRLVHLCAFRLTDAPAAPAAPSVNPAGQPSRRSDGNGRNDARQSTSDTTLNELFAAGAIQLHRSRLFDQPVAPKHAGFDFSRVEGMLLGLAIGDAVGNTTEGRLPEQRQARHGEIRDYLPNPHVPERRGLPSDDTQLSFWTLEQLIADRAFSPEQVARRFGSGHIFGIGQTVRDFLRQVKAGRPWYRCGQASAGTGALMRISPVLIPHLRSGGTALWADTARAAMLTHNDRASTAACVAFVAMLWELLDMDRPPPPLWWLERYVELAQELEGTTQYHPRGGLFTGYAGPLWRFVKERVYAAHAQHLPPATNGAPALT